MNIIKEGKVKNKNTTKFVCDKCGCEFECLEDKYWTDNSICLTSYPSQSYIYSSCPTCHKICRSTKTNEIKQYEVTLTNCRTDTKLNKHLKKNMTIFGSSL